MRDTRINWVLRGRVLASVCGLAAMTLAPSSVAAQGLKVVTTLPDLGSIAREIGGDRVEVTVIVKGPEDPHFAEPKPSFIKALSEADVFVQVGFDLEVGYVPLLLQNARNREVLPGGGGYLDVSSAVAALEVPSGPVDRSMGDVHPLGNPHYLLDPIAGLRVAQLIRERFGRLRPVDDHWFGGRYAAFRERIAVSLVGAKLAAKYEAEKLALLYEHGKLGTFLESQGDAGDLGGWLGLMLPYLGSRVVDDHRVWPYFARRFGFEIFGDLEPLPGVPPTTKHLAGIIARMRSAEVRVIITLPYYDERHARFVAEATDAVVVPLAHQVGALPETSEYLQMIDYNVRHLARAFAKTQEPTDGRTDSST